MLCAVCEKASNNRRVCPHCFTPYATDESATRPSGSSGTPSRRSIRDAGFRQGGSRAGTVGAPLAQGRAFVWRQSPVARWSALGIVLVLVFWLAAGGSEGSVRGDPATTPSNIIATPRQREEAMALIRRTRETALVEEESGEIMVSYPAATFPLLEQGLIALARHFAHADEIVAGHKRRIFFYNPSGRIFAQADGVIGVTVIR